MGGITNDFAWSSSRGRQLDKCDRAYYWHYYGSWGGWEKRAPVETREAYRLKKLTRRYMWMGELVHEAIKEALHLVKKNCADGVFAPLDFEALIAKTRAAAQEEFKASRDGKRDRKVNGRGFFGLLEHEYREPIRDEEWRRIWSNTADGLRWFFARAGYLERFAELEKKDWIEIDPGARMAGFYFFDDVQVWAAPDLAIRAGPGAELWDWKSGRAKPADVDQALNYALYLETNYAIPRTDSTLYTVYLRDAERVESKPKAEDFAPFFERTRIGMARATALLEGGDRKANKPLPREAFRQTEDRATCADCNFRRLCGRSGDR